jgi:hypothetical protein
MNNRTFAKSKNKNSAAFLPTFNKKTSGQTFSPKSTNRIHETSTPRFGHNFGDVLVESSKSFKQSCPLSLSSPRSCPFGGACHTCPPRIQTKLNISQPGDKYEQEADWVAERVTRMPEQLVQRQGCLTCNDIDEEEQIQTKPIVEQVTPLVQREVEREDGEEEEEELLQAKAGPGGVPEVTPDVQRRINSIRGAGKPLPKPERAFFEPRFGYDFSHVRVHTDAHAAESARALNARAFTLGHDIVFGAGRYAPDTQEGRRLLAHELTHVMQQNGKGQNTSAMSIQPKLEPEEEILGGITDCNVKKSGEPFYKVFDTSCVRPCIEEHEKAHVNDMRECCSAFHKAYGHAIKTSRDPYHTARLYQHAFDKWKTYNMPRAEFQAFSAILIPKKHEKGENCFGRLRRENKCSDTPESACCKRINEKEAEAGELQKNFLKIYHPGIPCNVEKLINEAKLMVPKTRKPEHEPLFKKEKLFEILEERMRKKILESVHGL